MEYHAGLVLNVGIQLEVFSIAFFLQDRSLAPAGIGEVMPLSLHGLIGRLPDSHNEEQNWCMSVVTEVCAPRQCNFV